MSDKTEEMRKMADIETMQRMLEAFPFLRESMRQTPEDCMKLPAVVVAAKVRQLEDEVKRCGASGSGASYGISDSDVSNPLRSNVGLATSDNNSLRISADVANSADSLDPLSFTVTPTTFGEGTDYLKMMDSVMGLTPRGGMFTPTGVFTPSAAFMMSPGTAGFGMMPGGGMKGALEDEALRGRAFSMDNAMFKDLSYDLMSSPTFPTFAPSPTMTANDFMRMAGGPRKNSMDMMMAGVFDSSPRFSLPMPGQAGVPGNPARPVEDETPPSKAALSTPTARSPARKRKVDSAEPVKLAAIVPHAIDTRHVEGEDGSSEDGDEGGTSKKNRAPKRARTDSAGRSILFNSDPELRMGEVFNEYDKDGDGYLSFSDFVALLQRHQLDEAVADSAAEGTVWDVDFCVKLSSSVYAPDRSGRMDLTRFKALFQVCNRCTDVKWKRLKAGGLESVHDVPPVIVRQIPKVFEGDKVRSCDHFQWTYCKGYEHTGNPKCRGSNRHDSCPKYLANCTLWKHKKPPKERKVKESVKGKKSKKEVPSSTMSSSGLSRDSGFAGLGLESGPASMASSPYHSNASTPMRGASMPGSPFNTAAVEAQRLLQNTLAQYRQMQSSNAVVSDFGAGMTPAQIAAMRNNFLNEWKRATAAAGSMMPGFGMPGADPSKYS